MHYDVEKKCQEIPGTEKRYAVGALFPTILRKNKTIRILYEKIKNKVFFFKISK